MWQRTASPALVTGTGWLQAKLLRLELWLRTRTTRGGASKPYFMVAQHAHSPLSDCARRQGVPATWAWSASAVTLCGVAPAPRRALSLLLRNRWVGILGDSVARLFCAALLRAVGDPDIEQPVLDRHRDFEYRLDARGSRVSFVWAPYAENITSALQAWRQHGHVPDVLVMSASLWHMLHVHNVTHYAESLAGIRTTLDTMPVLEKRTPATTFWMTTTALVNHKLRSEEKRARLTLEYVGAYDKTAFALLASAAGGPCILLDVHEVTAGVWWHVRA